MWGKLLVISLEYQQNKNLDETLRDSGWLIIFSSANFAGY